MKTVHDANVEGKNVLLRVDYNVPLENGEVKDDTRIQRSLPTINYLLDQGANLILCAHLGRPKGKPDPELSLKPIASYLENLLNDTIGFSDETVGTRAKQAIKKLGTDYNILMLENTRFNGGEKQNDPTFAKQLADLADVFVSDAFGAAHRGHASTRGVTRYIPGYAGLLMNEEVKKITEAVDNPNTPSLSIFGGAKISTKLEVLQKFVERADFIALGGGMANTFIKAKGINIGNSLVEEDLVPTAKEILNDAEEKGTKIILPVDVRIAKSFDEPILEKQVAKVVKVDEIPEDTMILDIGPKTEAKIIEYIIKSNTITWNGPMGAFEKELYREGTMMIAREIINHEVQTVIGGGETGYAINLLEESDNISPKIHISTGGGACLELMAGNELPGITCLTGEIMSEG